MAPHEPKHQKTRTTAGLAGDTKTNPTKREAYVEVTSVMVDEKCSFLDRLLKDKSEERDSDQQITNRPSLSGLIYNFSLIP